MAGTKKLDHMVIVDVESTCWEKDRDRPVGQSSEIIQIGCTVVDIKAHTISDPSGIYVKPQYSTVSKFCTDLTGITQEMLNTKGVTFNEACQTLLLASDSTQVPWGSWGDYDKRMFNSDCTKKGYWYPFGNGALNDRHFNIKTMFAIAYKLDREVGMVEALNILGLPLEGKHHDASWDSWNIARIFLKLLEKLHG
jgi:inhibitor of KinA sporulation pathway (predicted exonuclease)